MSRRVVVVLMLVLVSPVFSQETPKYNGKSAPEWASQLRSADADKQYAAAEALAAMGKQARPALSAIIKALPTAEPQARDLLREALVKIGKDAVPSLATALKNNDASVRQAAIEALSQIGPDARSAASALGVVVTDSDEAVRAAAVEALSKIGLDARVAIPGLLICGRYGSGELRNKAEAVILKMGKDAVSRLSDSLRSSNRDERIAAAEMLGRLGADAKSAIPSLTTALKDKEIDVREAAGLALSRVKSATPGSPDPTAAFRDFAGAWSGEFKPNPFDTDRPMPFTMTLRLDDHGAGTIKVDYGNPNFNESYTLKLRAVKDGKFELGEKGSVSLKDANTLAVMWGKAGNPRSLELKKQK